MNLSEWMKKQPQENGNEKRKTMKPRIKNPKKYAELEVLRLKYMENNKAVEQMENVNEELKRVLRTHNENGIKAIEERLKGLTN